MPLKKYVNGSWVDSSYRRYETGTDTVTNLPVEILTDGQPVTSWTMKGNTTTSGTPSPQNPITISGVGNETANLYSFPYTLTLSLSGSGNNRTVTNTQYIRSNIIELEPNTTYYFSGERATADDTFGRIALFTNLPEVGSVSTHFYNFSNNGNTTFTTDATEKYALVYIAQVNDYQTNYKMMLAKSATPVAYEPYGKYKISILKGLTPLTPIYLTQQLFKVGVYSDDVNSSGTATYNVAKYEFTGQEAWTWAAGTTFRLTIDGYLRDNSYTIICTHYTGMSAVSSASGVDDNSCAFLVSGSGNNYFYINDTSCSTTDSLKTYLQQQYAAGTPVTVYYVLATPTTETVTAPTITTTGGEVSIDVDTTVKPSELDLTYHGWHSHEPLKRENGAWV